MKKKFLIGSFFWVLAIASLSSCNGNKKENNGDKTAITTTENQGSKTENAPDSYAVMASPDSAILGKNREALVKVKDVQVVELMDAEGKSTGAELTVNLSVTNKSTIEKKVYFNISSSDARLELDNNNSIPASQSEGDSGPEAESTSEATWKFTMPAGTKPKKLNFFYDGTRVGVTLTPQK